MLVPNMYSEFLEINIKILLVSLQMVLLPEPIYILVFVLMENM